MVEETCNPPIAMLRAHSAEEHGIVREDPYHWLKDPHWQEMMRDPLLLDSDIRRYLEAENAYTEEIMAPQDDLKKELFEEMKARIKADDSSVPRPDGPYAYYRRFVSGGEYPVFCRCPRDQDPAPATEEVLLDGNAESEGEAFFKIASCQHSPDHRLVAFSVDRKGAEFHDIFVRDLGGTEVFDEVISGVQGGLVWAADSRHFFYIQLDENHRPCKVFCHHLGDDPAKDRLIYEEKDPGFFLGLGLTESRRFIVISAHDHTTSEIRLLASDSPDGEAFLVAAREPGVEYEVADWQDQLLVLTNAEEAVDFKIMLAPLSAPGRQNWKDYLPHEAGRYILSFILFQDWLVRLERVEALPRIVVRRLVDEDEHSIAFEEEAYDLGLDPGFEFDSKELRFTYSSMTTPLRLFGYDLASRERQLLKEQEIPSGHDPEAYETKRLLVEARDGAKVPVSLLYRRGTAQDGSAPLLLYGYGAYGLTIPASFSGNRFSLVDRGFIYAIAHIRGGASKGYGWYLDGKLEKKTNSFNDFIDVADSLVTSGYSSAGRIAAHGGSAGGMLVGVVANWRPDLFKAILAEVPFVDVLNTMCDTELPLTPPEWPEWGNPIEDRQAYDRIAAYSPYDQVCAQNYPHVLATAGLIDPRVTYWEPAKWVAKLRAEKTDDNLLLLRTNMTAGHAGSAGRFDKLEEVALVYAFTLKVFGLA